MAKKKTPSKVEELLDQLLEGHDPETILDRGGLVQDLTKRLVERALQGELSHHVGYEKGDPEGRNGSNSRNGSSPKTVKTGSNEHEIAIPRDRAGTFEPKLVPKHKRRLPGFDDKVIALYARGMTNREIQSALREIYDVEVSPSLITSITDSVLEDVHAWQARPLSATYPIVFLDAIHVKMRVNRKVENVAVYVALALNMDGYKELLGLWVGENEGARFWLGVVTELKNRGVEDILIAAIDGLKGFPEAIESVFPKTEIQVCVVHMVRNSLRFVSWKKRRTVAADLRKIYSAATLEDAELALSSFEEKWDATFPMIARSWRANWQRVTTFLDYSPELRKVMYTTNAIESINAQLRKVVKKRGAFPTAESILKVMYLAMDRASRSWTRPVQNWAQALNQLMIRFGDRVQC